MRETNLRPYVAGCYHATGVVVLSDGGSGDHVRSSGRQVIDPTHQQT